MNYLRTSLCGWVLFAVVSSAAGAQGAPDAPASATPELVARLAKVGSCHSPSFSPDARHMVFVSDMSGSPQVWKVPTRGGWPIQLTALDDTVSGVAWSPDGMWLAVSAAPGGGMNSQVYLVSPDGLDVQRVTNGGRETNRRGPWTDDGLALAIGSNLRTPTAMDGYLYNLGRSSLELKVENDGIGGIVDVSQDNRWALVARVAGRGSNDLYLLDLKSGDETLLTPHEGPGSFSGELSADGTTVWVSSNKGRDRIAFGRISIADDGGKPVPSEIEILRARDDAELEGYEVGPGEGRAVLIWNVGGSSELELVDLETLEPHPIDVIGDVLSNIEWSKDGRFLASTVGGANLPSNIWGLDLASGRGALLTNCPHPGVDLSKLVRPELVSFEAHDGLELSGWLYRPDDAETAAPFVVSFHGGPEGQERPRLRVDYQALVAVGIGVFAPNIRGSSGFGKHFVNLDNRELRFDANRDIASAAEYLIEQGIADRERIGIMGGSYGGYAVMVGVTEYPDLFAAGVNRFGMVNFETFFAHTEPWMAAISGTEYGDPTTQRDLLRRLSPIHKLDRVKTPLLVLHGANDTNVPVIEAEQVVSNLERRGVPVKFVLFEDEGHGFRKAQNRLVSTTETVAWFVEHLGD